ncbi:hypothetical protein Taro_015915 [Colocasia esculenta]|uniref:RING-type domain-containing protein n=1 Tax=Colocasia esculenta TaxID=4460 RepID=A0A843UNM7_COLES|nr:hypothetical protein [Colocasia esculenta]
MFQSHQTRPLSCRDSLKAIEADIHHANSMAVAIQRAHGGACIQMKLSFSPFATVYLFMLQWLDCACAYSLPSYLGLLHVLVYKVYTDGKTTVSSYKRQATLREFYGVIYPSLQQLETDLADEDDAKEWDQHLDIFSRKNIQERNRLSDKESEREKECGICLEPCTKMVLPNCNHAMCINCYRDWNTRSESCPFCRGSLRRITSTDLWVLTNDGDVVDTEKLAKENLTCFYRYIDKLPLAIPDSLFLVYYDYLV